MLNAALFALSPDLLSDMQNTAINSNTPQFWQKYKYKEHELGGRDITRR